MLADLSAGLVLVFVAIPLCLGIALASGAPLAAGLVSGVIGGVLVGALSGSHTSVSGPAAGLTAIVGAQITALGSFEGFLTAVVGAGLLQIGLGLAQGGFLSSFFPTSVIKGLLAAIGLILVFKQIPHLLGHDADAEGDMSFSQLDEQNTFSELLASLVDVHPGAMVIGLVSLAFLFAWDRSRLQHSVVPAPLLVVVGGVALAMFLESLGAPWRIEDSHLVQVPLPTELAASIRFPRLDWAILSDLAVYRGALLIAVVASLETLLNLEAIDKLDPERRHSPPNRELLAQGTGNIVSAFLGGLPVTSVVIRSSVNINAGGRTKLATIVHGLLLLLCVVALPDALNRIPLAALAAILIATGIRLCSPAIVRQMWNEGRNQFLPFALTVIAILFTDLLVGILFGLAVAAAFILHSNFRRPIHQIIEHHIGGDVLRIELANQVSFLNRAALMETLASVPPGTQLMIDARHTDYIDPDILDLLDDFRTETAPAHRIRLSLVGFKDRYPITDQVEHVDFTSREVQSSLTPARVLELFKIGNARFASGQRLTRDLPRQVDATAAAQYPMAVVLSCIDSRNPVELLFDLGIGDAFGIRIAGNVAKAKVLGSMEYACGVAGAKLVLVMGHTGCGAVKAAVDLFGGSKGVAQATGLDNLPALIDEIQLSIVPGAKPKFPTPEQHAAYVDEVATHNVKHTIGVIRRDSRTLRELERAQRIAIVGALYDIRTGRVAFLDDAA
jgi:carbonic anhydrase